VVAGVARGYGPDAGEEEGEKKLREEERRKQVGVGLNGLTHPKPINTYLTTYSYI
jgi:hypothetical protein